MNWTSCIQKFVFALRGYRREICKNNAKYLAQIIFRNTFIMAVSSIIMIISIVDHHFY